MAKTEKGRILIRGGLLADAATRRAAPADILVEDGVIRAVGTGLAAPGRCPDRGRDAACCCIPA